MFFFVVLNSKTNMICIYVYFYCALLHVSDKEVYVSERKFPFLTFTGRRSSKAKIITQELLIRHFTRQ